MKLKPKIIVTVFLFLLSGISYAFHPKRIAEQDTIPTVYNDNVDVLAKELSLKATQAFISTPIPSKETWNKEREKIKNAIIKKTGALLNQNGLALDLKILKTIQLNSYRIENVIFQSRPGVYATANLYIPNGTGPFPAVVMMMGHSRNGKLSNAYQSVGHTLALNGYVSLNIDPWGAGERSTIHGDFEYHGANLGASLMNIGESLMGMQITDNIRGIDLLSSLPYVDKSKIGATGASGGGNQTMWLTAMDERVKASVPVVSVGSFESYVMNSNCVCELLVDGLTLCEESAVLGLIAPRALLVSNAKNDSNPAFFPSEMKRSYAGAKEIFNYYERGNNISYFIADTTHGYHPPFRKAMLGWFDLHLKGKGNGEPKTEKEFDLVNEEDIMVFEKGKRNELVKSTARFSYEQGKKLKSASLKSSGNSSQEKKEELLQILKINKQESVLKAHVYPKQGPWERIVLETKEGQFIPILIQKPKAGNNYSLFINSKGKQQYSTAELEVNNGLILVDLWGIGENSSQKANKIDGNLPSFHTLSRSAIWLGDRTMGIWVKEISTIVDYIKSEYKANIIELFADKEVGIASLFATTINKDINSLTLKDTPLSYLFDEKGNIDYYNMSIHIPGILKWGDIALAIALSNKSIEFIQPRSITGRELNKEEIAQYETELSTYKKNYKNTLNSTLTIKTSKL